MSDKNLVIFISPHYEKSGETYVLYELVNNLNNLDNINEYKILNTHNDFTDSKHIIDFPFKFKPELKFLTKYFPWLKYRIYMICISLIYIAVFPFFIKKLQRNYKKIIITTRMCVSAISLLKLLMFNKNFYLTSSFAGIPHTNYLRKLLWPHLFKSVDQIVIPSDDMKDRIFDYTKRNDVNILPNPVITNEMAEVRKFIPRSKDQLKNEFKIICVGRLTYQKGFDVLIK